MQVSTMPETTANARTDERGLVESEIWQSVVEDIRSDSVACQQTAL
jgi:hypothetical protein